MVYDDIMVSILVAICGLMQIADAVKDPGSIKMLVLADWGGTEVEPYSTPSQRWTATAMGKIGNFYLLPQ